MDQSESNSRPESVDDVISHYGVLGMHWGRRKPEGAPPGPMDVGFKERAAGKKVVTTGGKRHPATQDALNAATYRQKANKSSTDSLTTKELTDLVNRMNMEQNYERLRLMDDPRNTTGQKFAKKLVKDHGADAVMIGGGLALKSHPASAAATLAVKAALMFASKESKKSGNATLDKAAAASIVQNQVLAAQRDDMIKRMSGN